MNKPALMPIFPGEQTVQTLRHWAKMTAHDGPTGYALEASANFLENVRRMMLAGIAIVPRLEPTHPESMVGIHAPSWDWPAEARRLYGGRIKSDDMARAVARLLDNLSVTLANSDTFVAVVGRDMDSVRASVRRPGPDGTVDDIAERLRDIAKALIYTTQKNTLEVAAQHIEALEDQARESAARPAFGTLDWGKEASRLFGYKLMGKAAHAGVEAALGAIWDVLDNNQDPIITVSAAGEDPDFREVGEPEKPLGWVMNAIDETLSRLAGEPPRTCELFGLALAWLRFLSVGTSSERETATLTLCASTGALRETMDQARTQLLKLQAELLQREPADAFKAGVEAVARAIESGEVMAPMAEDLLRDLVRTIRDVVKPEDEAPDMTPTPEMIAVLRHWAEVNRTTGQNSEASRMTYMAQEMERVRSVCLAGIESPGPAIGQNPGIQDGSGYYPSGAQVLPLDPESLEAPPGFIWASFTDLKSNGERKQGRALIKKSDLENGDRVPGASQTPVADALPEVMDRLRAEARAASVARASRCGTDICRLKGECNVSPDFCRAPPFKGDGR